MQEKTACGLRGKSMPPTQKRPNGHLCWWARPLYALTEKGISSSTFGASYAGQGGLAFRAVQINSGGRERTRLPVSACWRILQARLAPSRSGFRVQMPPSKNGPRGHLDGGRERTRTSTILRSHASEA